MTTPSEEKLLTNINFLNFMSQLSIQDKQRFIKINTGLFSEVKIPKYHLPGTIAKTIGKKARD